MPRPFERIEDFATEQELAVVNRALAVSFVGGRDRVRQGLASFIHAVDPDELIITGHIHDHEARLRSFEIAADLMRTIGADPDSSAA